MPNNFVPLEELKLTVEWARLNTHQRGLIEKWIELDHDKDAVIRAQGRHKSAHVVQVTAARNFGSSVMKDVIARHFGMTPSDMFQEELRRAIRDPKTTASRIQALKIMAKSLGLDESVVPTVPEGTVVAEKEIVRDGRRLKTTIVDLGAANE